MDYKRDTKGMSRRRKEQALKRSLRNIPKHIRPIHWLFIGIGVLCFITLIYFGTDVISNPDVDALSTGVITQRHTKHQVVAELDAEKEIADAKESASANKPSGGSMASTDRGMSGYTFDGTPIEIIFLSSHGEKGFTEENMKKSMGDRGQAYGIMQFDYRHDLVQFMGYAYAEHPDYWSGFAPYITYRQGDARLINNTAIEATFTECYNKSTSIYLADQINRMRDRYFNDADKEYIKSKTGIDVNARHIAIEAAFLSAEINNEKGMDWYINHAGLNDSMTDAEIIHGIYDTVRTRRSFARFKENGEEAVAKGMIDGTVKATETYILGTPWSSWAPGWDGALAVRLSDQGGN